MKIDKTEIILGAIGVWVILPWITHVVVCLKDTDWGFLIAGAIFFPVAWVHGTGVWFGLW